MKKTIILAAMLLLAITPIFGQDLAPDLGRGTKAMLFTFDGFSTLRAGDFEGGVGAKYYLMPKIAVRGGLQFASASEDIPANPSPNQQGTDGEESATRFGVSGAIEVHTAAKRANAYVGGGLGLTRTTTESKSVEIGNPPPAQDVTKNDPTGENINGQTFISGTSFNVFALAGIEFFLFKEISLAAEYRLGLAKLSRPDAEFTSGTISQKFKVGGGSNFGISNSGLLTIAVYF
jgi:hypothetical protein